MEEAGTCSVKVCWGGNEDCRSGGRSDSVGRKEGAEDGVSDKAGVGAFSNDMGCEFTGCSAVNMPADIACCMSGS